MYFAPENCNFKIYFFLLGHVRTMATTTATERKHTKLKVIDNVAVITLDSPNVKVKRKICFIIYISLLKRYLKPDMWRFSHFVYFSARVDQNHICRKLFYTT